MQGERLDILGFDRHFQISRNPWTQHQRKRMMRSDTVAVETSEKIAMRVLAVRRMASRIFQPVPRSHCIFFATPTCSADQRHIHLPVDRVRKSARNAGHAGHSEQRG
ncbi:hypothetical protein [Bradyrhizobium sp. USDA 4454]